MKPTKEEISKTPSVLRMLEVIQEKVEDKINPGAPVLYGDIIEYLENRPTSEIIEDYEFYTSVYELKQEFTIFFEKLRDIYGDKRKSVNEQTIKCIEYIYNLVK